MTRDLWSNAERAGISGIFRTAKAITAHRPLVNAGPIPGMGTGDSGRSCATRARILSKKSPIQFKPPVDEQQNRDFL